MPTGVLPKLPTVELIGCAIDEGIDVEVKLIRVRQALVRLDLRRRQRERIADQHAARR